MSASAQKSTVEDKVPNPQRGIQSLPQKAATLHSNTLLPNG